MFAVKRNNRIISKHKTRKQAELAMNKKMQEESKQQSKENKKLGWVFGCTYCTGIYCISKV